MKRIGLALALVLACAAAVQLGVVLADGEPEFYVYHARVEGVSGAAPEFIEDPTSDEGHIYWAVSAGKPEPGVLHPGKLSAKPGELVKCTCPDDHESCYCSYLE